MWRSICIATAVMLGGFFYKGEVLDLWTEQWWTLIGLAVFTGAAVDAILSEIRKIAKVTRSQVVIQEAAKDETNG